MLPPALQLAQPLCLRRGQCWVLMAFSWCTWENRAALVPEILFRSNSNFLPFGSCHAEKRAKPPIDGGAPRPCSGAAPLSPGKRNDPVFLLDFPGTVKTRLTFGQSEEAHGGSGKLWSSRWGSGCSPSEREHPPAPTAAWPQHAPELQKRKMRGKPFLQLLLGAY